MTFFELDSFAETSIPSELREILFPLTLLEFTSLLKPITTDVNSDTPDAWSSGMVELTRNFADEAVVPSAAVLFIGIHAASHGTQYNY